MPPSALAVMRALLRRVAAASPLVPALAYTASAWLANVAATLAPGSPWLLLPVALLWVVTGLLFVVVVTWFRDDDWLSAGFLLGVTLLLSAWTGDVLADAVRDGSILPALASAPGILFGVVIRGVVTVPLLGGIVAALRWATRRGRPAVRATRG